MIDIDKTPNFELVSFEFENLHVAAVCLTFDMKNQCPKGKFKVNIVE